MNTFLLTPAELEILSGGAPAIMHDFAVAPAPVSAPAEIPHLNAPPGEIDEEELLTRAAGGDAVFCRPSENRHAA